MVVLYLELKRFKVSSDFDVHLESETNFAARRCLNEIVQVA
jgi:hypothetical protein